MKRALVLVAVTLAGCATPAVDVASTDGRLDESVTIVSRAGSKADVSPMRILFGEPVALPKVEGFGGGEPNIAVLPDGTLFVAALTGQATPDGSLGPGYLWRSSDHGATWERLRGPRANVPGAFCSCDSDVVTSPDGWVYYTDWWIAGYYGPGPGNYLVDRSPDGGETWESTLVTTREALLGPVDRQWLVAGEDGFVGLFYSYFTLSQFLLDDTPLPAIGGIHAVFSNDHGATWGEPVVVMSEGDFWQIAHPRIFPDGTMVIPYGLVPDADGIRRDHSTVMLGVSTDGGRSWEHHQVAEAPLGFDNLWAVQADVDQSGAINVAWSARVDDDIMATYVATSRDVGRTWTDPLALRAKGLNFLPWVATYGNTTLAVGWYGGDATGDPSEADAEWFAYVAESHDGGNTFTVQRVSDDPVKVGAFCPRGGACQGDRELGDYASLAYDPRGNLHYAFARAEDGIAATMVANEVQEASA